MRKPESIAKRYPSTAAPQGPTAYRQIGSRPFRAADTLAHTPAPIRPSLSDLRVRDQRLCSGRADEAAAGVLAEAAAAGDLPARPEQGFPFRRIGSEKGIA